MAPRTANPTPGPSFPTVEGGDDTVILNYVAPTTVVPPPVHMEAAQQLAVPRVHSLVPPVRAERRKEVPSTQHVS